MAKFGDYFKEIVSKIIGGVPTQDNKVTDSLTHLDDRVTKTSYGNYFEMLTNYLRKDKNSGNLSMSEDDLRKLYDTDSDYQDTIYDLFVRRQRYKCYNEMTKKISRLRRAMNVLRSNILVSDSLNNISLTFYGINEDIGYNVDKEKREAAEIFKTLHVNEYLNLKKIIDNTLEYGDYFIEIASTNDFFGKGRQPLLESESSNEDDGINKTAIRYSLDNGIERVMNISLETNTIEKSLLESEHEDENTLNDLVLLWHRPHNVIKLSLGDQVYGYIIIPENVLKTKVLFQDINVFDPNSVAQNIANTVMNKEYSYSQKSYERATEITRNIINFLKKSINEDAVEDSIVLKSVIMKMVLSSICSIGIMDKEGRDLLNIENTVTISNLKFRFVDTSRMQEFCLNPDEYAPYGTSIFDSIMFDASLLVADKVNSSIERLTKSIERRIINFDCDNRDTKNYIERLKEKFRKKKALFDGSTSFDNIPSVLSPFEEYFIPTRDGTPFVSFSTEPPSSTVGNNTDDMKFKRDEAVSNLDVPPAYVGLEENIESKATLFLQSTLFAITVIDYQEMFASQFTSLLDKIKRVINRKTKNIVVRFAKPIILSSASELEHIGTVAGNLDFLLNMGLDKRDVVNRYLPFLKDYYSGQAITKRNIENMEHGKEGADDENNGGGSGGGGIF